MSTNSFGIAKHALLSGLILASCCGCGHPVGDDGAVGENPPPPEPEASATATVTEDQNQVATTEPTAASEGQPAAPENTPTSTASPTPHSATAEPQQAANATKETIKPEPKASPMPKPSLVPNPKAVPVSFWKAVPEKTLRNGEAGNTKWTKFAVPLCRYTIQLPGNMNVAKPQGFPHQDSRIIWAAGSDVKAPSTTKIMIIPWGLNQQQLTEEIKKAEVSWFFSPELVQSATLTNQAQIKVGKYSAIRNTYSVIPLDEKSGNALELQLVATYVSVGDDCFALVMSCPQDKASQAVADYEKMVNSLSVSNGAPKLQAPPPDRAPKDMAPKGEFPGADKKGAAKGAKPAAPAKGNQLKPNMPLPSIVTEPANQAKSAPKATPAQAKNAK